MPMYETGMPVSTSNPKITHNGVDYNIVESVFADPAVASTNLSVVSSNAGDNTQNIVIYGIVAGVEVSESIALNGVVPAPMALDFTEVFEAYLDAVCAGTVTISDSTAAVLGTIAIGRRVSSPDVFKRVGIDGNEVILPLNGGCEFIGEVLEGQWKKDWDADIVTYTAMQFRFAEPVAASANLIAVSSAGGDTTQTLTVTGLVAGAEDTEAFALNGAVPVAGAKDFTEVWKMELDAVCAGTVTLTDSIPNTIYVLPIGDLLRERFTSLMMGGESNAAGDLDYGWLNNHHPFVQMNDAELTVEMEIPTALTGGAPTEDIFFEFYIRDQKELTTPTDDPNFILVRYFIDENGLLLQLYKEVGGVNTLLWDGSTADGNDGANPTGDQFWIFRFLFNDAVAGAAVPEDVQHMHVYAKHGDSRVAVEAATEEELFDTVGATQSPYDISDLLFTVGYPAYQVVSAHTTWFGTTVGSQLEAISTYLRTSYPSLFSLKYDFVDADYGGGDVELWDTKGSAAEADWQQVFDEDHVFTGDAVLQNGLVRTWIDEDGGLKVYGWIGAAWVLRSGTHFFSLVTDVQALTYPFLKSIESVSPEKVVLNVRMEDTTTENADYYVDLKIIIERGSYYVEFDTQSAFPIQDVVWRYDVSPVSRFGYVGDDTVGDDDIDTSALNTTLTDNFTVQFDDAGNVSLVTLFSTKRPAAGATRYNIFQGRAFQYEEMAAGDILTTTLYIGVIPFSLVANLFIEAEDDSYPPAPGTDIGTAGTVNDANASPPGGAPNTVQLNAIGDYTNVPLPNGEYAAYALTAGTHIPAGRYLAVIRAARIGADTMEMYVWNDTDDEFRNEENAKVNKVLTLNFNSTNYEGVVFDITAADVTGGDTIVIVAEKTTANVNEIRIDYMLVIPIGDGESFPQDLSHAAMRTFDKPRRLYVR